MLRGERVRRSSVLVPIPRGLDIPVNVDQNHPIVDAKGVVPAADRPCEAAGATGYRVDVVAGVAASNSGPTYVTVDSRARQVKGAAIFGGNGDNTATQNATIRAIAGGTQKGAGVTAIGDRGRTDFVALNCSAQACAAGESHDAIGLESFQCWGRAVALDARCGGGQRHDSNE